MPGSRSAVLRKVVRPAAEADRTAATDRELLRAFARDFAGRSRTPTPANRAAG
jgi:hypothetical protein